MTSGRPDAIRADVAIVGGGPAGIAAAVTLSSVRRSVVIIDTGLLPGGQIWRHASSQNRPPAARRWLTRLDDSGATLLSGASVVDASVSGEGGQRLLVERDGAAITVSASATLLAAGARERFLPFPGWTLPGVVGIGAAQALVKTGWRVRGKRVVIAGSGPLLLPVAASLSSQGARLAIVAEQAPMKAVAGFALGLWRSPRVAISAGEYRARFARAPYRTGTWITRVDGRDRVEEATLTNGVRTWSIPCDVVCAAFGLVPNTALARVLGCAATADGVSVDSEQCTTVPGVYAAGESVGIAGVDSALIEGEIAALVMGGDRRRATALVPARDRLRRRARTMEAAFALRGDLRRVATADTIVCRCEDVRLGDLRPEWTSRQAKLYVRAGMGACQGRVCGPALQFLDGWEPDTVRAPLEPAMISTLLADRT